MMSDERLYSQVKNLIHDYHPEVPQQAYSKMRRALWWSNFTKLSTHRFNLWYLLLVIGAGTMAFALSNGNRDSRASQQETSTTAPQQLLGVSPANSPDQIASATANCSSVQQATCNKEKAIAKTKQDDPSKSAAQNSPVTSELNSVPNTEVSANAMNEQIEATTHKAQVQQPNDNAEAQNQTKKRATKGTKMTVKRLKDKDSR
ncbi:MAG: hypothetical protein ACKVOR_02705 [Flavobacteriales bacterium]